MHDLFPLFIKNLDPVPLRYLLNLVSALQPSVRTEQTLYLALMLINALWNNVLAAKAQLPKQLFGIFINLPTENKKEEEELRRPAPSPSSPAVSPHSSSNSETHQNGGSDTEMDEQLTHRTKQMQEQLSDTKKSKP